MLKHISLILLIFVTAQASIFEVSPTQRSGCEFRHQVKDPDTLNGSQLETLENCLYYYLLQSQGSPSEFMHEAPWEFPLIIDIEYYQIHQVDLLQKSSSQFNIHGEVFLSWKDTRLEWNETEWKVKDFALHDNHHIWTPTFNEDTTCSSSEGCISKITDIEISNDGTVQARFTFRYPSFCGVDYSRYPEETNDCCLLLTVAETEQKTKFEMKAKEKMAVDRPVALTVVENGFDDKKIKSVEASIWTVTDRTIDVVKLGGYRNEFLRLCVHAKKRMSTLRIALRIPATIATMLMLTSPLFGDLKVQSFVKLATLFLQTICFLFMCSIAPENGFGQTKPKIYNFYEFLFFLSFLSIMVTLICLALCRVQRTVPPSHFLFLSSKLVNRFFCCIEPESNSYQRHLEDGFDSNRGQNGAANIVDYTHEWRQVYVAANNAFSGLSFILFCFVIIFEIM